jgi:hypothetical protein
MPKSQKISKAILARWKGVYPPIILPVIESQFSKVGLEFQDVDKDGVLSWKRFFPDGISIRVFVEPLTISFEGVAFKTTYAVYSSTVSEYLAAIKIWECSEIPFSNAYWSLPTGVLAGYFAWSDANEHPPHSVWIEKYSDDSFTDFADDWKSFFARTILPFMKQIDSNEALCRFLLNLENIPMRVEGNGCPRSVDRFLYSAILLHSTGHVSTAIRELQKGTEIALVKSAEYAVAMNLPTANHPRKNLKICGYEKLAQFINAGSIKE